MDTNKTYKLRNQKIKYDCPFSSSLSPGLANLTLNQIPSFNFALITQFWPRPTPSPSFHHYLSMGHIIWTSDYTFCAHQMQRTIIFDQFMKEKISIVNSALVSMLNIFRTLSSLIDGWYIRYIMKPVRYSCNLMTQMENVHMSKWKTSRKYCLHFICITSIELLRGII